MAKTTIEEICENAKLARDMALTGNYDSACIYYEGLQGLLARQLKATADPLRKGKWSMVSSLHRDSLKKYISLLPDQPADQSRARQD